MRQRFFLSRLRIFLLLILVPIVIFGSVLCFVISSQALREARKQSGTDIQLVSQMMDMLTADLDYYRVSLDYDSSMHVAVLSALLNDEMTYDKSVALRQAMQYLYASNSARAWLDSIYITMEGSQYLIADGVRYSAKEYRDQGWQKGAACKDAERSWWMQVRSVRKNRLDDREIPVVSIYQRMKYNEVLIVNVKQEYFNRWLDSVPDYEEQALVVTDAAGQVMFANQSGRTMTRGEGRLDWEGREQLTQEQKLWKTAEGSFGMRYFTAIPLMEALAVSRQLLGILAAAVGLSFVISSVMALVVTERDYQRIYRIIDVFDRAEKGEEYEFPKGRSDDPYFCIINNVIHLFVSQTYLKVQLEARKYSLLTARLTALQYQLNPHFLFNTLQVIDLEILKALGKRGAANRMIYHLSELLRYSLEDPERKVTVGREIEMTRHYIELQKQKAAGSFQVLWEYEEDVKDFPIPRLLLQPIIENSLEHAEKPVGEKLLIKVKLRRQSSGLYIWVLDNGKGMDKAALQMLQNSLDREDEAYNNRHIGLKNIVQRLRLGCKGSWLRVKSRSGRGTIIEIWVEEQEERGKSHMADGIQDK